MAQRRITNQRKKILQYLQKVRTHPSAEMVYEAVKKNISSLTLATTYRNLHLLSEEGKVLKLEINGEFRFDGYIHNHVHFVCNSCSQIEDIDNNSIFSQITKICNENNLQTNTISVISKGTCQRCI